MSARCFVTKKGKEIACPGKKWVRTKVDRAGGAFSAQCPNGVPVEAGSLEELAQAVKQRCSR